MAYSSKISKILKPKVVAGRSALGHNYKTMSTTKKAMVLSAPAQFKVNEYPKSYSYLTQNRAKDADCGSQFMRNI